MRNILFAAGLSLLPLVAFAQTPRTFSELVYFIISFINPIASILAAVAMLIFFYGIVLYIFKSADSESHDRGRQLITWGLVALFVLFSVWSLAGILVNTFFGGSATSTFTTTTSYYGASGGVGSTNPVFNFSPNWLGNY